MVIPYGMDIKMTAQDIVNMWPSKRELADDINRITGAKLQPVAVTRWCKRNSIPAKYDAAIIQAATERNKRLSVFDLMGARAACLKEGE